MEAGSSYPAFVYHGDMFSEKQLKIMAFQYTDYDALICTGAIRSGKSSLCSVAFIDWAMENFNGCLFGIAGKTVGSATQNVVRPYMAMTYTQEKYRIKFNRAEKLLIVTRGNVTNTFEIFGGRDERSQDLIQGRTLAGILLDEVALMPQSFVNQATARCSVSGSKMWFNCNPDNPRHWFYTDWILRAKEHNALVLEFTIYDNPSLDERIIRRYESQYNGVFYQRYILGKWVMAEGLVYQFDSEDEYTYEPFDVNGGIWYVSIDYGITNPFAAILWNVHGNVARAVDLYYFDSRKEGRRRTDEEHYDALCRLVGDRDVEAVVIDPSANSFREVISRHGRFFTVAAKNDVINGIATTDMMLHEGIIKISTECADLIAEMGMYRWDESKVQDAVIKEYDHACDAMRYFAYTTMKPMLRFEIE